MGLYSFKKAKENSFSELQISVGGGEGWLLGVTPRLDEKALMMGHEMFYLRNMDNYP